MKDKFKKGLFRISNYFDNSLMFTAVRRGMIMMIPLLVIGSMALMLKCLPIPAYQRLLAGLWNGRIVKLLDFIHGASFNLFAVALSLMTSFNYAMLKQSHKGTSIVEPAVVMLITLVSLIGYSGIQYQDFSISSLGTANVFTALFVALLSSVMFFKIKEKGLFYLRQRMMDADGFYVEAVSSILPVLMIVSFFAVLRQVLETFFHAESFQAILGSAADALLARIDNEFAAAVAVLLPEHGLWFVGIHGSNVVDAAMQTKFSIGTSAVFSKTFHDVFVLMGGTGAVLCIVIAILLFSRKNSIRNVARLSFPTVIFNISEIISFGLPVILNPIFLIPYLLAPMVIFILSYAAVYVGLVPHVTNTVEWTTPVFLSGYLATGSIAGSILQAVCLVVGVLIYLPFLRLFEEWDDMRLAKNAAELTKELQRQEAAKAISSLTARRDSLGSVARVLATDLKDAIHDRKLFLLYQPQVDAEGKCMGAEALIRWIHPIAGFIYPPLIIQLAKEEHILHEIELFLFDEASRAIMETGKVINTDFKISVNITNESLMWESFEDCVGDAVRKYKIPSKRLWLEITEQDALVSSDEVLDKIRRLKENGHQFLIDDFGMGHTSLMYLQTNYFGVVKLDGSLTKDVLSNNRNKDIIEAITGLGESLHFETIAEYVETQEQRDRLLELGCSGLQGYLYSKPIKLEELIVWMREHT
ncbi:MAG: EAL domain-containing protein [Roseburia sp.]|nr:EAL domain-containing protein [Roseburia sp.]